MSVRAPSVIALLLLLPVAGAQGHAHLGENGMSMVLFDGPPDGRALVGAYTHFGFALLDSEGKPVVHQNAEFNVLQNGDVLLSTTDTHEYDGLFSLDMRFTRPGPYEVIARSGEMTIGRFEGVVLAPETPQTARIDLKSTSYPLQPNELDITISIVDEAGAGIPHSDAIVEFREVRTDALYSRSHLHFHDSPIKFRQGFSAAGEYIARVVGYVAFAEATDPYVPAVVAEFPLTVGLFNAEPPLPRPPEAAPAPLEQVGAKTSADGYTLHAMYDPNNQVGVGQTARIAALIMDDATLAPAAHVDFEFGLTGPRGTIFFSNSLHEYDGMFEFLFTPDLPGNYHGAVTARRGDMELTVPVDLLVVPGVVPAVGGMGPITIEVDGIEEVVAGVPANLTFSAQGPAGPAAHSEVDVTVFHDGEPPLYQFKLHTHGSGLTNALLVFPHEGEWKIRIDGLPTVPEPSVYLPALVELTVAPGAAGDQVDALLEGGTLPANVPNAWAMLSLLALAATAVLGRARRS